jgi:metallo-beta-lactamase family protein
MKIIPYGAAGEVTGSCYYVETRRAALLIDCGLFQSGENLREKNTIPEGIPLRKLNAVLITHAHLDHVGRLPLLVKAGYHGPIYGTAPTHDLIELVLSDAAKVQAQDIARLNRKRQRAGIPPEAPLFTMHDVEAVCSTLKPLELRHPVNIAPGVTVALREAGHILGSASIELRSEGKTIIFSGDLGPRGLPILRDPEPYECADAAILESTYGDRDHKPMPDTLEEFRQIIRQTIARAGKVLIPSFAIGRTQQILYHLAELDQEEILKGVPIFVDSPMATRATEIYQRYVHLFDDTTLQMISSGAIDRILSQVQFTESAQESMAINHHDGGMCNAGRILHHLKYHLWKPETAVIIVGFQTQGTLGRRLVDGAKEVRIFGEPIAVNASIHTLGGFSAHAGQSELVEWFQKLLPCTPRALLVHGEDKARIPLSARLKQIGAPEVSLPTHAQTIEI